MLSFKPIKTENNNAPVPNGVTFGEEELGIDVYDNKVSLIQ